MSADLTARRTAAAAALADYRRAGDMDMIDRALWAGRLADMLMLVLFELNALDKAGERFPEAAGQVARIRALLDAFDPDDDDRQYVMEAIAQIVGEGSR